ncbi:MAG: YhgE/Pip domain-containing protein [Actinobacteria bacterium HGW-Actinobacteria-2]|nr:MAG: YhgE/Pip domain-containing protein [Actinobacteria bacterium HGW-Actinobacteria-2]
MFAWTSHGTELKRFTRQPITRAAIAVMLLIPLLYGAMYVWAFWDPTTRMNDLPVALVNSDVAAKDDDGTLQHYGTDVVDELTDDQDLGWVVTDPTSAAKGLDEGKYYFSVTIPADFTARINGLGGKNPQAANVLVSYDDSNSFLATRLGQTAMLELQSALREKVGKEAVDTLLVGVGDARDGFNTASDGAFRLADGLSDAVDGADKLNVGAAQLAAGAKALAAGTTDAATGADQLSTGLDAYVTGVSTAASGAQQLSDGAAGLSSLQDGLAQAADPHTGAPALAAGIQQLASSLSTLTGGVTSFNAGAHSFSAGADTWVAGAQTWRSSAYAATGGSLTTATTQLADGADGLASATASGGTLASGATQVSNGASSLASGLGDVNAEVAAAMKLIDTDPDQAKAMLADAQSHLSAAKSSAGDLADGADQVSSGIASVHAGASDLASGASSLKAGWGQIHSALAPDSELGTGLSGLAAGQQQLATGAAGLSAGAAQLADPTTAAQVQQLVTGSQTLATGLTTMSAGAADPQHGIPALQAGAKALAAGFTNPDPTQGLVSGAKALQAGADALASGLSQAQAGSSTLSNGATKLAGSTPALASGLVDAHSGADELGTKLADGADEIPNDSATVRDARAEAISVPVTNTESHVWPADSWGEGFAPFFISLALWVGALITWLLLRPLQTRALMTSVNGLRMAWGSLNSALLLSVGQVAIMLTVMHFAIGLNPKNVLATVLFSLLTAAAFFALQQFFQITLGSAVGKVVIIVLLMVQLASAGGTYPIQTTPDFLQAISPFMPMTYVVNGLREAITGGIEARFWASTAVLATIFVVSLLASSVAASRKRVWTMSRLHPALSI